MFKKHKNGLLRIIVKNGLDPKQFDAKESKTGRDEVFVLSVRNTPSRFEVHNYGTNQDSFWHNYPRYERSFSESLAHFFSEGRFAKDNSDSHTINQLYRVFEQWVQREAKEYIEDLQLTDLWEQMSYQQTIIGGSVFEDEEMSDFSEEEKVRLRRALEDFRSHITATFKPNQEQQQVIEDRLKYLSTALDKLNRFDWKSVLISATLSISVALTLDTAGGKMLFDLLSKVFSNIRFLLP
jgi:hypothetical protein